MKNKLPKNEGDYFLWCFSGKDINDIFSNIFYFSIPWIDSDPGTFRNHLLAIYESKETLLFLKDIRKLKVRYNFQHKAFIFICHDVRRNDFSYLTGTYELSDPHIVSISIPRSLLNLEEDTLMKTLFDFLGVQVA